MSDVHSELQRLQELKADFQKVQEIDKTIQVMQEEMEHRQDHYVGESIPDMPLKDTSVSEQMKKEADDAPSGTYACLYTLCLIVIAVVGLFSGTGAGKLLSILAAGAAWIGGSMGVVGAVIGGGLGVWIGWSCWSNANPVQMVILVIMFIAELVFAYLYSKADKAEGDVDAKIKQQREQEEADYQRALTEYEIQVDLIKQRNAQGLERKNQEYWNDINSLKFQRDATIRRIEQNDILCSDDKKEEVVDFLIARIQQERAYSVSEALLQYDDVIAQRQRETIAQLDRQMRGDRNW